MICDMAPNGLHSDNFPGLTGPVGELQTSPNQPGGLVAHGRDQAQSSRRRSSTSRRLERNAETFGRNRTHRVRRVNDDVSRLFAHRARTRSLARIETEQRQQQQQSRSEAADTGLQNNTGFQPTALPSSQPTPPPSLQLGSWKPSIVLGSFLCLEGEDLNAIQIADRKIAQTRLWADHYRGVPDFVRMHQEAVEARRRLDETAEVNIKPRSALNTTHASAIQKRLEHLRPILQTSEFPPEHANIEAAITGYESGAIPYSDSYTLIWAGRIVDRCPDFDSFTVDRSARLDRYVAEYGPGWLWYEPPLSGGGGTFRGPTIIAKKGICLENKPSWRHGTENMGHYRVNMGFRRRKVTVSRGQYSSLTPFSPGSNPHGASMPKKHRGSTTTKTPKTPRTPRTPRTPSIPQPNTSRPGTTIPDLDGPRIFFDTLLDTGATLPVLYEDDMAKLGISRYTYAAQSSRSIATADSLISSRVYELDVCVAAGSAHHHLPRNPKTPLTSSPRDEEGEEPSSMQCTIPVIAFAGSSADFSSDGSSSDHAPDRLSGILPFHVCYTSSAPGNFAIWMGEERRDVLGAGRLPGKMRYGEILGAAQASSAKAEPPGKERRESGLATKLGRGPNRDLKTPERVIFEHDFPDGTGRVLRDEDSEGGNVIVCGPRGADFDHLDAAARDVEVYVRTERKRQPPKRRGSEVKKPARKKERTERTEKKALD